MRASLAVIVVVLALCAGVAGCGEEEAGGEGSALNIVFVLSDDQTYDSVDKMPWLSGREDWAHMQRAYANQPWCCPSRASILSGQFAHRHGVVANASHARHYDAESTIATSLDDAGYETGLFGKYLNGFPWERGEDHVPPGWDAWTAFIQTNGDYYDYSLAVDGAAVVEHGDDPADHSTSVFTRRAVRFVAEAPEPFFALVTPYTPHEPTTPSPGDEDTFAGEPVPRPPNFNAVAPDQPRYYRELKPARLSQVREAKRQAWAATLGMDEMMRRLHEAAAERGILERTVFVYMSDNGFSFGSHRFKTKNCLYEECARVPLAISVPGAPGGDVPTPISNVDLAPTLAGLAGAEPPAEADGEDLSPQLLGEDAWPRDRDILLEVHESKQGVPEGYGVVNSRWKYNELVTGETELYDLRADPYELENLAGEPAHAAVEGDLAAKLAELAPERG